MLKRLVKHVSDLVKGKAELGQLRSSKWHKVREEHLAQQPTCQVCEGDTHLQVHHIRPFHSHPEHELDPYNLLTLCEKPGHDCHLYVGHLLDFKAFNPNVVEDSKMWNKKIKNRKYEQNKKKS